MRVKKSVFTAFCGILGVFLMTFGSGAQGETTPGTASVSFPEPAYTFDAVFEGTSVSHDFVIRNKGTAILEVKRVEGG
jgi:hypothetical protein